MMVTISSRRVLLNRLLLGLTPRQEINSLFVLMTITSQQAPDLPGAPIDYQPSIDLTELPSLDSFDHAQLVQRLTAQTDQLLHQSPLLQKRTLNFGRTGHFNFGSTPARGPGLGSCGLRGRGV
jgi:hypothetical protein